MQITEEKYNDLLKHYEFGKVRRELAESKVDELKAKAQQYEDAYKMMCKLNAYTSEEFGKLQKKYDAAREIKDGEIQKAIYQIFCDAKAFERYVKKYGK